ncbi:MAG: diguanylate cyclase protein [Clostridiales bacterium]|nr:diguanylate cyclase protein [Clostridiales bacterium]
MFKKKILIIDDSELMVKIITDVLIEADYQVISAPDGYKGLQKVREEKPDLVILDVVMPGMSGFEVCKRLRDDESNNLMPIIMLTSQDNEDDKLTGLELGADDYIIKPFNSRELLSRVKNTLKRIDRNRLANPLTGLHGNLEIQSEVNRSIAKKELFCVIYADLDNFKAYNDVYGFASGDRAIKLTADIVMDNVHSFGTSKDFIGHIGGDDFVIITIPHVAEAICNGIIGDFDKKIGEIYTIEDRARGYISTANRQGMETRYPIMSISLAVLSNKNRNLESHIQVAEIAAELKKKAKMYIGSNFVVDRRLK